MLGPFDFKSYLIVALIFIPLEMTPLRPKQRCCGAPEYHGRTNLLENTILIQLGLMATIAAMIVANRLWMPHAVTAALRGQPVWLQLLEIILIADIGFYWAHRAFHTVPFLWKFHSVHHSIEEMDWLAAYRSIRWIRSSNPCPIFPCMPGYSDPAILAFVLISKWQSLFILTNCLIDFGPLKWLLSSPQFHHWHHAYEPAAINKNYAAQLPFLDLVFRTPYKQKMPPEKYGTNDPVPVFYHQHWSTVSGHVPRLSHLHRICCCRDRKRTDPTVRSIKRPVLSARPSR